MNKLIIFAFIILLMPILVFSQNVQNENSRPFITIWQTDNEGKSADNQITIPGEGTDYLIEWREIGNPDNIGSVTGSDEHTVTFPSAGLFEISISGNFTGINFGKYASGDGDAKKILDVVQWGDISWTSLRGAFIRASNLDVTAMDIPDLSKVTDLSFLFFEASSFNGDLSSWDVSNVAVMTGMFVRVTTFNGDLSGWDVSNVQRMGTMFSGATSFNGDLSRWDVSSVTDMRRMFINATSFNGDLNNWDVSNVTSMASMFSGATSFNQNLGNWDIGMVSLMNSTGFGGVLDGTALSVENYDNTLLGWASQQLQNDVELSAEGLQYCASEQARQSIIDNFGWSITGDILTDECATSLITEREDLPMHFALDQNYPNPFNPGTNLRFAIPVPANVQITVYNLVGQKVAVLINEQKTPGWHTVYFDATGLSSGLYIYRLKANEFIEDKTMLLLK